MVAMERETKDIEALLNALNRSAERLQTLWFSFLGVTLYFLITALTTTHRMLLLEEGQSLPIINLKVPLLPFYTIAPILYGVMHFYILMMLLLLARSAAVFEEELKRALPYEAEREDFRMRAENALFLQLLIGAREERSGFNGKLLAAIALITLAIGPVATLLVMQLQFLPYHDFVITWLHRGVILLDVLLIILLWRGFRFRQGRAWPYWPNSSWGEVRPVLTFREVFPVLGIAATLWLTTGEGRWAGEPWLNPDGSQQGFLLIRTGVFSDRLSLSNETLVGEALFLEKQKEAASGGGNRPVPTRDFRGRNFAYADFSRADLRGSSFAPHPKTGDRSVLRGANLSGALMHSADLSQAQMQGSDFSLAKMPGVDLTEVQMQGSNFRFSQMQGADFSGAGMQGAYLFGAQLQGAYLFSAQMQGADLISAQLQGANLFAAEIEGSRLVHAQLQGANLSSAKMRSADLRGAIVFRTVILDTPVFGTDLANAWLEALEFGKTSRNEMGVRVPLADADIERWLASATAFRSRTFGGGDFERLKGEGTDQDKSEEAKWQARVFAAEEADPGGAKRRVALAKLYGDLICAETDSAFFFARGIFGVFPQGLQLADPILVRIGDQFGTFIERLKAGRSDPAICPGVAVMTQSQWETLAEIMARPFPPQTGSSEF